MVSWLLVTGLALMAGQLPTNPVPSPQVIQPVTSPAADDPREVLSQALRQLLLQLLPGTLYDSAPGWGNTTKVANGLKWTGQGLQRHAEVQYTLRNDGIWRKIRITSDDPAHTLQISLSNLQKDPADRMTFMVTVDLGLRARVEQQRWQAGVRLYSASARARMHVKIILRCEASMRLEMAGALLPDFILQFRILESQVAYDRLVVEHLAGFGGTGARWLGEAVRATIHELRPSLEQKLLARANAAIVRAGDSREVRLSVGNLLPGKKN
jgi:hypothetical protein